MKKNRLLVLLLFFTLIGKCFGQTISEASIKKHISFLASDKLKGRGTSSLEELKAAKYIALQFEKMKLIPKGTSSYFYEFTFKKNTNPHDTSTKEVKERKGYNVLGFLNNDAEYTIVIGAHYDHLGLGNDHNSLDANPEGKIHNGADDNASGVAGLLELADYYSKNNRKEKYNFLFIAFSGEELGLIGSKKWCDNPTYPLDKINYMINLDMIGRLNDSTSKLMIYGVGTAAPFVELLDRTNYLDSQKKYRIYKEQTDTLQLSTNDFDTYFKIKKDSSGIGPSDQTSFYLKGIPVLHFFTGQHGDYHKPSDDVNNINFLGEKKILEFIAKLVLATEDLPKLQFLETKNIETKSTKFKVTMGVMPDYTFEGKGMRIDGVSNGKPAAKAGLAKGDIVIALGEDKIEDVMTYMKSLGKFEKGDSTTVIVNRNGKEIIFPISFE